MGNRRFRSFFAGSDPSMGMRYNALQSNWYASTSINNIDIARTPMIVKSIYCRIDVQRAARRANDKRMFLDKQNDNVGMGD